MLRVLSVLFLAFLLSFPVSSQSNPPPSSTFNLRAEQLQQQNNQLQTDLKAAQNISAEHDKLIAVDKSLEGLVKRVEDIHQYVAYWGWCSGGAIALFGILITGIMIFASFRITNEAKIAARLAAEEEASTWFNKKGEEAIQPFLRSLQIEGKEAVISILQAGVDANKKINDEADQQRTSHAKEHRALLSRVDSSLSEKGKVLDPNDVAELHHITKQLRQKPEEQYSFDDWRALYIEITNRLLDELNMSVEETNELNTSVEGMEHTATDDWQNATAKIGRATLLAILQQHTEAIKLRNEIFDEYGASDDPRLIGRAEVALIGAGYLLYKQGKREDAIAVYDALVMRYGARNETDIAELVAQALINKGLMLGEQGQWEASIAAYDDLVTRYGARSETDIAIPVAQALFSKSLALHQQGQAEASIAAYGDLVTRFGARGEAGIAVIVAQALFNQGLMLGDQGQREVSIDVYGDLVTRYGARNETNITMLVASALFNRAIALHQSQRIFEAKVAYASLIERYALRTESEILKLVEKAKNEINELSNT